MGYIDNPKDLLHCLFNSRLSGLFYLNKASGITYYIMQVFF